MPFDSSDSPHDRRCSSVLDRWTARGWSVCMALALAWVAPIAALNAQIPDREGELEAIRDQIMVLQSRLNRVSREEQGLRGEVRQTAVAIELQEKRVEEARTARLLAEESLEVVGEEVLELEASLEELRGKLKQSLADLYRMGQQGYLRLFLSIRSEGDLLPGIRQMRFFVRRDSELLNAYLETYTELEFQQEQALQHRADVEDWLGRESSRLTELGRLQQRQTTLLAQLERERESLTVKTAELSDKERKLSNFLDFLYGRTPAPLSGTPVQNFKGVLDWPIQARISKGFGPRLDPVYGTRVPHNGLELATPTGREVRVVFPGKVLYAAPFQGYGLTAVVHHPGRVFSLYAGLGELRVGAEDVLSLGQVIGIATDTLYFEIREENRPVDPAQWLR